MKFELIEIKKIDSYNAKNETVYDIEVDKDHSFCVDNNIIVHNSACKTYQITGVGYPQLSTIIECSKVTRELGGLLCSDGSCKTPGDVCKAIAGGADFVMLGNLFSGHAECEADWEEENEIIYNDDGIPTLTGNRVKTFMKFSGMSSAEIMEKYYGGVKPYRTSEGKTIKVPYK